MTLPPNVEKETTTFTKRTTSIRRLATNRPRSNKESDRPLLPGMATRTSFDKAEIVLRRRARATFHVEVWRSFAPHLVAALTEAARGAAEW